MAVWEKGAAKNNFIATGKCNSENTQFKNILRIIKSLNSQ